MEEFEIIKSEIEKHSKSLQEMINSDLGIESIFIYSNKIHVNYKKTVEIRTHSHDDSKSGEKGKHTFIL